MTVFAFEDFEFDSVSIRLSKAGKAVPLEPQVGLVLNMLVQQAGSYVTRANLLDEVWEGRAVSPAVVDNRIRAVRRAIGDDGTAQRLIKTFPNKGYMFVGAIEQAEAPVVTHPEPVSAAKGALTAPKRGFGSAIAAVCAGAAVLLTPMLGRVLEPSEPRLAAPFTAVSEAVILPNSVAVLPFGGIRSQTLDQIRDISLENVLIANLLSAPALRVISPLSSFRFAPDALTEDVSKTLGARYIISGELINVSEDVRLMLRLSDTTTNTVVFAETYTIAAHPADLILASSDAINAASLQILNTLGVSPDTRSRSLISARAFEAYQYAEGVLQSARDETLLLAIEALEDVVEAEPNYIPAYKDIVKTYHLAVEYAGLEVTHAARQIDFYATKARIVQAQSADLFVIRGLQQRYRGNLQDALAFFEDALGLDETHEDAALFRAEVLELLGDAAAADAAYATALTFDPLSPSLLSKVARSAFARGRHQDAILNAKKNLVWNPSDVDAQTDLAVFRRETGDYVSAYGLLNDALSQNSQNARAQFEMLMLLRALGRMDLASQYDLNSELRVLAYTFAGEEELARLAQKVDPMGIFTGFMEYTFGDGTALYEFLSTTGRYTSFLGETADISALLIFDAIFYAHASVGNSDSDAARIRENVRRYFEARPLPELKAAEEYMALAGLYALDGNVGGVREVMQAAVDNNMLIIGTVLQSPVFADVKDDPIVQSHVKAMQDRASDIVTAMLR